MLRSVKVGMAVALLAGCGESPTASDNLAPKLTAALASSQGVSTNQSTPLNATSWVSCANGGVGENVTFGGMLHETFHTTQSTSGMVHVRYQVQPQGVVGIGAISGSKYIGTGITQESFGFQAGSTHTFINNFRMIGQGSAANFTVHETLHVTVNAIGVVTSDVDRITTTCE